VEPVALIVAESPDAVISDIVAALPALPDTDPRPVLHVPKLRLA
jgi:hypothetical protein